MYLGNTTGNGVLGEGCASNRVGSLEQADRLAGGQTEVVGRIDLSEIVSIDVDFLGEDGLDSAHSRDFGMERHFDLDTVIVGHIVDDDFDRVENHHQPGRGALKVTSDARFELLNFSGGRDVGHTKLGNKGKQGAGRNAASTKGDDSVKTRVIPVLDVAVLDKLRDLSFGEESTLEVETCEFVLTSLVNAEGVTEPFVGFASGDKFDGTERVPMRMIIRRVQF